MSDEKQPCTREDLEGYVINSAVVTLDNDGLGEEVINNTDVDLSAVDEYVCMNCTRYWRTKKKYDAAALQEAWKRALAHLDLQSVGESV